MNEPKERPIQIFIDKDGSIYEGKEAIVRLNAQAGKATVDPGCGV
jgi:hypothetical protein